MSGLTESTGCGCGCGCGMPGRGQIVELGPTPVVGASTVSRTGARHTIEQSHIPAGSSQNTPDSSMGNAGFRTVSRQEARA